MSILGRALPALISNFRQNACNILFPKANFHAITQAGAQSNAKPGSLFDSFTRNIIRCHFPRPSERKRIKRHGYWKRMSTPAGRRIIMRRILKGKHVLSH